MTPPLTTTTTTTLASTFRAKTNSMKSWRPRNPPSNRDRLELYALHKQSVSGDAPATDDDVSSSSSVADKAKLAAWRTKRGMTQADAMQRYVEECECRVVCGAYNVPTQPCIIYFALFGLHQLLVSLFWSVSGTFPPVHTNTFQLTTSHTHFAVAAASSAFVLFIFNEYES